MSENFENEHDLIDLSLEDAEQCITNVISTNDQPRNSLDSNPFDRCLKLSSTSHDPFEDTEMQALRQTPHIGNTLTSLIKTADLLSLNDSSKDCAQMNAKSATHNTIDAESPPSLLNYRLTSESDSPAATESEGSGGCLTKSRKFLSERQRLLKLSICNSTFSSPVTHLPNQHFKQTDDEANQNFSKALVNKSPLELVQDNNMHAEPRSAADFDADLAMMTIPALEQFEKSKHDTTAVATAGLAALRAKLQTKQQKPKEVTDILQNIRNLFSDADQQKQQELDNLLKNLERTLHAPQATINTKQQEAEEHEQRQLQQANLSQGTHSVHSNESAQEIPELMISSSATYDGEAVADVHLPRPEIAPVETTYFSAEINSVLNELGKVLEHQQQQNQTSTHNSSSDSVSSSGNLNPTFIVVMNTPVPNPKTDLKNAKETSTLVLKIPHNGNLNANESTMSHASYRRRSSSLSAHDHIKYLSGSAALDDDNFSPPIETNVPKSKKTASCIGTPARSQRRNTISTGTPFTPRYATGSSSKYLPQKSILETSQEDQATEVNKRLRLSQMPNVMKRTKPNTSTASIMKSSAPLKATLPMKYVVPRNKVSPPTPVTSKNQSKLNTSIHFLKTAGKISHTSTPMAAARNDFAGRRMSVAESKSPAKASNSAFSANITRRVSRNSLQTSPTSSKQCSKAVNNAASGRLPLRSSNSRLSMPISSSKSKENKQPK